MALFIMSFLLDIFVIIIVKVFIALYKKVAKTVFVKYPTLSKLKGLISGVIIFFFLMVFVLLIPFLVISDEFLIAIILWFILRKVLKNSRLHVRPFSYIVPIVCFTVSLMVGYVLESRSAGYQVMQKYLETVNENYILLTGKSYTPVDQEIYRQAFSKTEEFKSDVNSRAWGLSLPKSMPILFIMTFLIEKEQRNLEKERRKSPHRLTKKRLQS